MLADSVGVAVRRCCNLDFQSRLVVNDSKFRLLLLYSLPYSSCDSRWCRFRLASSCLKTRRSRGAPIWPKRMSRNWISRSRLNVAMAVWRSSAPHANGSRRASANSTSPGDVPKAASASRTTRRQAEGWCESLLMPTGRLSRHGINSLARSSDHF
jgi:hypothetical protein